MLESTKRKPDAIFFAFILVEIIELHSYFSEIAVMVIYSMVVMR